MHLRPLIGIVNLSTNVSNADVTKMIMAVQHQLKWEVAPAWGKEYWFIMFYPDPKLISPRAVPIVIADHDSAPNILGWHAERGGKPYGKILTSPILQSGGVVLHDSSNPQNISVSSVLSHEVIEMFCDPNINVWIDGPQIAQGSCYAMEVCDPVESNLYNNDSSGIPVTLSNFVLPTYYDEQSNGKFDFLGILTAPFTFATGGYMIVREAPGTEQEVFAETLPNVGLKKHKLASRNTLRAQTDKRKKWWKYLY